MKKNKILAILSLTILFLLPFGNYANAQVPDYIGVNEGDQYTWKAEVNFEGVDNLLDNVRDVIVDLQSNLDLGGLESLTIAEIYEQIANIYLSNILPVGWEGFNISTLVPLVIEDYIVSFNSTVLAGMIPSNWEALNFTDFYHLAVEGLNSTLPGSWENDPFPELFRMLINELNSTIFYGLIPAGWEDITLEGLLENLMMQYAPTMWESVMLQLFLEEFLTIDYLTSLGMPPEILVWKLSEMIDQLVLAMFDPDMLTLTATELFEGLFLSLNASMPGGMESESMATVIDLLNVAINMTLPLGYDSLSMTELLAFAIDELENMTLPVELHGLTIQEIVDLGLTEALIMFDSTILPGWDETYLMMQGAGILSYEVGLRVVINNMGTEIQSYSGGPMGVPIDMDIFYSLDFENWIDLSTMLGTSSSFSPLMIFSLLGFDLAQTPLIIDPSTYSSVQTALMDQFMLTSPLIVANNYDWETIQTEMIIATTLNPDCIGMSVEWNSKGVLQSATVRADGAVVASFKLMGGEGEIPGFEIPIILGVTCFTILAISLYRKRKR